MLFNQNKIALITGSTGGIGKATAYQLAERGFDIILTGRNVFNGEELRMQLLLRFPEIEVYFYRVDFASIASIYSLADRIKQDFTQIDVLINNVGLMLSEKRTTEEGIDELWMVNHLAGFLLSHLLLDLLSKNQDARIVNVSGGIYQFGKINPDRMSFEEERSPLKTLAQAKLANLLWTFEAARRWQYLGIKLYAVDPGAAKTPGHERHQYTWLKWLLPMISSSTQEAAYSSVLAASSPLFAYQSGIFLNKKGEEEITNKMSLDQALATKVWDFSLESLGLSNDFFVEMQASAPMENV